MKVVSPVLGVFVRKYLVPIFFIFVDKENNFYIGITSEYLPLIKDNGLLPSSLTNNYKPEKAQIIYDNITDLNVNIFKLNLTTTTLLFLVSYLFNKLQLTLKQELMIVDYREEGLYVIFTKNEKIVVDLGERK
jgi:hypothetical protein